MLKEKSGQYVYVSDISKEDALQRKDKRIFLCNFNGLYVCVSCLSEEYFKRGLKSEVASWKYIAKIPSDKNILN